MSYLKLIPLILGLLFSFVTNSAMADSPEEKLSENKSESPSLARVITPKAIVYADENMNSPLGYLSNGKVISVGNPRRLNRELVPLVIEGRVAFIEIKNLQYENTLLNDKSHKLGAPREHNFDVMQEKPDEKLSLNNSFYLALHRFGAGEETKQTFMQIEGETKDTFAGLNAQFIHRLSQSRFFWGVNFDSSTISTESMELGAFFMGPVLGYTPFKNPLFLLDLYGSLDISLGVKFQIDNNFEKEPTGTIYGPQFNARMVFFS